MITNCGRSPKIMEIRFGSSEPSRTRTHCAISSPTPISRVPVSDVDGEDPLT
jgi:hypothetical protein